MNEAPEVTEDTLLGGRVRLKQPRAGYRVAIDPVFLAAAVPAEEEERVLDVGCGVGAAALCLAARVTRVRVVGLDRDEALVRLAAENARLNGVADRVTFVTGAVGSAKAGLPPGGFDHVMTNPPFGDPARVQPSPDPAKRAATVEDAVDLKAWLDFCLRLVRPHGTLSLIHRTDRLDAILSVLSERTGDIVIFPLWPASDGRPAKRVIVRARKGATAPLRLNPGLVLHGGGGAYTDAAESVLRRGERLHI